MLAGAALFFVGVGFTAAVFVPFLLGSDERGAPLSLATFLTVAGLAVALIGLARQAKGSRRRATPAPPDPDH